MAKKPSKAKLGDSIEYGEVEIIKENDRTIRYTVEIAKEVFFLNQINKQIEHAQERADKYINKVNRLIAIKDQIEK